MFIGLDTCDVKTDFMSILNNLLFNVRPSL